MSIQERNDLVVTYRGVTGGVGRVGEYLISMDSRVPNTFVIGTDLIGLKYPSELGSSGGYFVPKLVLKSMSL